VSPALSAAAFHIDWNNPQQQVSPQYKLSF
jgi:hypothetical protein